MISFVYENRYAMTFGRDDGFKDGAESIILSAPPTESIVLPAHAESIILSAGGAESIRLSSGGAESMMLSSCLQEQRPRRCCH